MFFIMGLSGGRKALDYAKMVICRHCGSYGRYEVFMTYSQFSLFFIPIFKWNRHFYVKTTCCGMLYELKPEIGRRILNHEDVTITGEDLFGEQYEEQGLKKCEFCGYDMQEDFEYCPKCGRRVGHFC